MKKNKAVTLGGREFMVISLMEAVSEKTEVFPGDPPVRKKLFSDINKTGYHHFVWEVSEHSFHPHGDAPSHQNLELGDRGFDFFSMDYFFNNACLIDLSYSSDTVEKNGVKWHLKVEKHHLSEHESLIRKKGAVLIRTGYDRIIEANRKHEPSMIPYLTPEAGEYLAGFDNLRVVGIDSLTVDEPGIQKVHRFLKDTMIVESLVNLHGIPAEHHGNFDLQTATVAIAGGSGGAVAAFVFIAQ